MLLLCMRVLWRREAAELKGFLLKPALITHRQTNLAVGFLFSGTKQSGTNSRAKQSGQTVYDKHSERNQSAASRAPQTLQEPMGGSGGNSTLRARGFRFHSAGVDW